MDTAKQKKEKGPVSELERAKDKRSMYLFLAVVMLIVPVVGYIFDGLLLDGLVLPTAEELRWLPLNFGTYGIIGICAFLILFLIVVTIKVLISSIGATGFSIVGIIVSLGAAILVYGLLASAFIGVLTWIYNTININFAFSVLGMNIAGSQPIPGISETLGVALVGILIYVVPLLIIVFKALSWNRKYRKLLAGA